MYIGGFVTPVAKANKQAYLEHLNEAAELIKEFGVTRMVEAWGDDLSEGKVTDFFRAVDAKEGETVLFSWFEWPSKEVRDQGVAKMMNDNGMENLKMPFDGKRMIFGGFNPIFDTKFN